MQYQYVGDNGKDYTVKILRGAYYTNLWIKHDGVLVYEDRYLPVCKTKIESEDNAERIALRWIENNEKNLKK